MEKLIKTLRDLKDLVKSADLSVVNHKISTKAINKQVKQTGAPEAPKTPKAPTAGQSMSLKDPKLVAEALTDVPDPKQAVKDAKKKSKKNQLSVDNGQFNLSQK
ncbi:MAG: hypothetical protein DRI46_11860 [Chloroflexi bacterium]|nr:MAG: hypothetical protein DRI46_11860 [Chloroflexota bacterium]